MITRFYYQLNNKKLNKIIISFFTISDIKSGPRLKLIDFVVSSFFGLPPERLKIVNYSSGSSIANAGPKIILVSYKNFIKYLGKTFVL